MLSEISNLFTKLNDLFPKPVYQKSKDCSDNKPEYQYEQTVCKKTV